MKLRALLIALLAMTLAACSREEPEPFHPPDPDTGPTITAYDPGVEPSRAVLPLVPEDATRLAVTDFAQLRLSLGFGDLDGRSPQDERQQFWNRLGTTAALSDGLLRGVEQRLREEFSFGSDDVLWEANWSGEGVQGWAIGFRADLPVRRIRRAIRAGVGPLADGVLDAEHNLVTSGEIPALDASWAQYEEMATLTGREAGATWIERGCVGLAEIYGDGILEQLQGRTAQDVANLDTLDAYAVALGAELVTVLLGEGREDAFIRMRLPGHLPALQPEFGRIFAGGVASPSDGVIGYRLTRPARAAEFVQSRQLPFAACAD